MRVDRVCASKFRTRHPKQPAGRGCDSGDFWPRPWRTVANPPINLVAADVRRIRASRAKWHKANELPEQAEGLNHRSRGQPPSVAKTRFRLALKGHSKKWVDVRSKLVENFESATYKTVHWQAHALFTEKIRASLRWLLRFWGSMREFIGGILTLTLSRPTGEGKLFTPRKSILRCVSTAFLKAI
jgi:hypothetical protein